MPFPAVDPFKVPAYYMKKTMDNSKQITTVVKITDEGALECYGDGSMETFTETKLVNLTNFMKAGFIPATKEEFDRVNIRAAREINAINAIV